MPSPTRVLVVYGSETGNVRRGVHSCVAEWQGRPQHGTAYSITSADVVSGNEAADEFKSLAELVQNFDVLIIATSSFGEGDPPANFLRFLLLLVRAASAESKPTRRPPLAGLQHAVVGYGQSVYPTFMSCPRYTDKLLEALGSRRMVQRVEIDEGPTESVAAGTDEVSSWTAMSSGPGEAATDITGRAVPLKAFAKAVHAALLTAASTADAPAVCPWTVPGDSLVEKSAEELLTVRPETLPDPGLPQWVKYAAVASLAAALTHYAPHYLSM
tara:strand:- start:1532 stop:2344 length:813 start_codon:yes stop_codon:yes gene_type:complete